MIAGLRIGGQLSFLFVFCIVWTVASAQESPGQVQHLTGIWRSVGYGSVLDIHDDHYTAYQITSISAVKVREGKTASIQKELGAIRLAAAGDRLAITLPFTLAPIEYARLARLPDLCSDTRDLADPESLFEIVWHTFNEQYAFFELRDIDWSAEYRKWRPQVTANTADAELFRIIASMVSVLGDNHVVMDAAEFDYSQYRKIPDFPLVRHWRGQYKAEHPDAHFTHFARSKYEDYVSTSNELISDELAETLATGANDQLMWGIFSAQIGYLNVRSMAGFCENEAGEAQLAALAQAVDRAISDLADVRAIIVDVRFNGGGWDDASLLIASRFADKRRAVLSKQARAGDTWSKRHTVYVEPGGSQQFTRPVVLLTGPMTVSAAEVFTYCMNALPHVTQAGLPTMGIHSDMLERHLPNGWKFYLSNEVYRNPQGKVYEKVGIPPDHRIGMFTLNDFRDEKNKAVVQALQLTEKLLDD